MKKILYIAISSQTGGVPRHILNLLKHAKANGLQITVAVPDDGEYYHWFQEYAADMVNLRLKPYSLFSLWKLRQYVRKHRIRLIHSHGKGAGMYARPLKLLCPGVKVIHTFHGVHVEQYGALVRRLYCLIEHILRFWTDRFICVSKGERGEALRLGFAVDRRTQVICNGIDPQIFDQVSVDREALLKEFGFPAEAYVIGTVARLEKIKGLPYLLSAFAELVKKYPQCRLLLVGDGPDRRKTEDQIRQLKLGQAVYLAGFRHDLPRLLKLFDLYVSTSLKEGLPYTLIEALAAGVPVVATNVTGNRDVIKDGKNGFLVPARETHRLRETIEYAMKNPKLCDQYIANGKAAVNALFTEERMVKELVQAYWTVMKVREDEQ